MSGLGHSYVAEISKVFPDHFYIVRYRHKPNTTCEDRENGRKIPGADLKTRKSEAPAKCVGERDQSAGRL